jgi:hypothetical protein
MLILIYYILLISPFKISIPSDPFLLSFRLLEDTGLELAGLTFIDLSKSNVC